MIGALEDDRATRQAHEEAEYLATSYYAHAIIITSRLCGMYNKLEEAEYLAIHQFHFCTHTDPLPSAFRAAPGS